MDLEKGHSRARPITEEKPSSGTKGNYSSVRARPAVVNSTTDNWVVEKICTSENSSSGYYCEDIKL